MNRYFLVKRKVLLGDDSRVKSLRIGYALRYDSISIFRIVYDLSNTISDRRDTVWVYETCRVTGNFRHRGTVACDDGTSDRVGLHNRHAKSFVG